MNEVTHAPPGGGGGVEPTDDSSFKTDQSAPNEKNANGKSPETETLRVLVVDDDRHVREGLRDILEHDGYLVEEAGDGKTALQRIRSGSVDLTLLDLKLPRAGGMEVLCEAHDAAPGMPIVIISGKGSITDAVQAIKLGAYDYLEKPVEAQRALVTAENALEHARVRRERDRLLEETRECYEMVGSSAPMQRVYDRIDKAARVKSTVLITGESGTGKERVARAIHHNSDQAGGPFVTVNCAALPPDLIESELFGHAKGAFTGAKEAHAGKFEQAGGGTLFLDEIGDMSLNAQSKVLRALEQEQVQRVGGTGPTPVDVRLIAATNQDLETAIEAGSFREDLYYRLDVISLEVPPLRARREDIPELAAHFLEDLGEETGQGRPTLTPEAVQVLMRHDWPGNVRELRNAVEQLVVFGEGDEIGPGIAQEALGKSPETAGRQTAAGTSTNDTDLETARSRFENAYIQQALREHEGNVQDTADALQIDRSTLWRKMKKYGIESG